MANQLVSNTQFKQLPINYYNVNVLVDSNSVKKNLLGTSYIMSSIYRKYYFECFMSIKNTSNCANGLTVNIEDLEGGTTNIVASLIVEVITGVSGTAYRINDGSPSIVIPININLTTSDNIILKVSGVISNYNTSGYDSGFMKLNAVCNAENQSCTVSHIKMSYIDLS